MTSHTLNKLDFISARVLIALGAGVVLESLRMPRLENLNINPYTVPGLVPGILGVVLLILGTVLLIRSILRGGWRISAGSASFGLLRHKGLQRLLLALLLTLGYAAILVGRLPFWLATFLFVAAFIILFELLLPLPRTQRLRSIVTALIQAVLVAVAVTFVFQEIFLVRLP
jgi:putative tricarboxylic transport membrane protein